MMLDPTQFLRARRRLIQAEGYLELGMSQHTLDQLDGLDDFGPLEPLAQLLRGKALWAQRRYAAAADSLLLAAQRIDSPHNRPAWLALSLYYRDIGAVDRAVESLARARGARAPGRRRSQPGERPSR
ncbi:MAG: hypothetical protein JW809_06695 [Pirellulales bacterium]|nr:hypothetical protein [Pirellulales bacterium]